MKEQKSIPVELCVYALRQHRINMVMVYIYLKYNCDGYFKLSRGSVSGYAANLSLSVPTFRKHINELIKLEWLTVNSKREAFRVIGFLPLAKKLTFRSSKSVIFDKKDFITFRAFLIATVITYFMGYKRRKERRSVYKKGCTITNFLSPSFYSMPNRYLSKVLKISISTASDYKHLAGSAGYISITKQEEKIPIPKRALTAYLEVNNMKPQSIRRRKGSFFEQKPDKIESTMEIKTKHNLKKEIKKQKNFRYDKKGGIGGK